MTEFGKGEVLVKGSPCILRYTLINAELVVRKLLYLNHVKRDNTKMKTRELVYVLVGSCLLLSLACGCGKGPEHRDRDDAQKKAVAWLKEMNARQLDLDDEGRPLRVDLGDTAVTDDQLENLAVLSELTGLGLIGTSIDGSGLVHLRGLKKLEYLNMDLTNLTDASLAYLKELNSLQSLYIGSPSITDAGIAHLKGMTHLKSLFLSSSGITDAGLEHLKELTELEVLVLRSSSVTDAAVEGLRPSLPRCQIVR